MTVCPCRPGLAALLLLSAGCGDRPAEPLAVVRGTVTFRGVPLPAGMIVFTPDDESGGRGACATGTIGLGGRFTLATDGAPGASPGKYLLTIAGPDGWRLPDKFLDPRSSGLRWEVVAGRENDVVIDLEKR